MNTLGKGPQHFQNSPYSLQQAILDSTNLMIISTDLSGIITVFNKSAQTNLGYSAEEIVGKTTPVIFHSIKEIETQARHLSNELGKPVKAGFDVFVVKALQGLPEENEWTYIRKDGSSMPVSLTVTTVYDIEGQACGYLGIVRDRTELKKFQFLNQQKELRYQKMVENASDSIITIDSKGIILTFNKASENLFGYDDDQIIQHHIWQLFKNPRDTNFFDSGKKVINIPQEILNTPKTVIFKRQDNTLFSAEMAISQWNDGNVHYVLIIRDISEREKLSRLKNEFISTVSHELRTPLTSISGALNLILNGQSEGVNSTVKKLLHIAFRNSERLVNLVNDILDIDKIESDKMSFNSEKVDLALLIPTVVENNISYAAKFLVNLHLEPIDRSYFVFVDASRFTQVLTNIISNAIKFSPQEETVIIKVQKIGYNIRISVIDHGPGISVEFQKRIFQKFSQSDSSDTRPREGTGLGLNISKLIIEQFGGTINFESKIGDGSTFFIDLHEYNENRYSDDNIIKKKILICEDDADEVNLLNIFIQEQGFDSVSVTNIDVAIKALSEERFDLLLLDITLPGKNGIMLIEELQKQHDIPSLPIAVITGTSQPQHHLMNNPNFPVICWLRKPFDPFQLMLLLEKIMKSSPT